MCFFRWKRGIVCALATKGWVLCREPHAGTAEARIFQQSPELLAPILSGFILLVGSIFLSFPPVSSRDLRFWLKMPRALLGKLPFGDKELLKDAAQMKAQEDGLAQSRSAPGGHWERSGNDVGLGFGTVHPAGKQLLVQCNLELVKRFTSLLDLQISPPAFAQSSAGGWSIWRGKGQGKEDFCSIEP